jgi:hypothetical protein
MSLGSLQAFIDSFQQSSRFQREQNAQSRDTAATAADGRDLLRRAHEQDAPPMGQPPAPPSAMAQGGGQHPLAALAQLLTPPQGGQPSPGGPPGGAPPPAGGQNPLAAVAQMGGGQGPQPQQAPPPPRFPDPKLSGTAQPAPPGGGHPAGEGADAMAESQQNITSIASSITKSNPGIDPITLAMAVSRQVETIKGVAPLTKATMQYQMQSIVAQQKWTLAQQKLAQIDEQTHIKYMNAKTAQERVKVLEEGNQLRYDAMEDAIGERRYATDATNNSREGIAAGNREGRMDVAGVNAGSRQDVADTNQEGREYSADQGFRGNQARGGGRVDPAPQRRSGSARPSRAPAQRARAPAGPPKIQDHMLNGKRITVVNGKWVPGTNGVAAK